MTSQEAYDEVGALPSTKPNGLAPEALRSAVLAALTKYGEVDADQLPQRSEAELLSMPEHLFFIWCDDHDGLYCAAIPESEIDERMDRALTTIGSSIFVGSEDFSGEEFGALLRVMAAVMSPVGIEHAHAIDLLPWIEQETGSWSEAEKATLPSPDELRELDGRWADYFSMDPTAFDRRYSRAIAIRKTT